jgi:hypothetical protein
MTTQTPVITHDEAMRVLRAEYFDTVRGIVADLQRAIKDKEVSTEDEAQDWLHETVDGHQDVIYTYKAQQVLLHSDNTDAYVEEYGAGGVIQDGAINWSVLAYAALLADVRDAIGSELEAWIAAAQEGGE